MIEDSHAWFRDGPRDMAHERSGLELDTAGLSPALLAAAKFLPALPAEQSHGAWASQTRDIHVPTAALLGMISVQGDSGSVFILKRVRPVLRCTR